MWQGTWHRFRIARWLSKRKATFQFDCSELEPIQAFFFGGLYMVVVEDKLQVPPKLKYGINDNDSDDEEVDAEVGLVHELVPGGVHDLFPGAA
jgi:hypothetical protein